jgi:hypothetical protein
MTKAAKMRVEAGEGAIRAGIAETLRVGINRRGTIRHRRLQAVVQRDEGMVGNA